MEEPQIQDEAPPILGTWKKVYIAILVYLAIVILAFYGFTIYFAP
jgi:hypothetical protein